MAVDLNLKAPMLLTQAFAAGMVKNQVLQHLEKTHAHQRTHVAKRLHGLASTQ